VETPASANFSRGITATGIFLAFGAVMASVAAITLIWRDNALHHVWALNPRAYNRLAPYGRPVGILFLLLAVALAVAAVGWLKHRRWGWRLAAVIIALQVLGDFFNLFSGRMVDGAVGVTIAGALLLYMTRGRVRSAFR
jgi:hypothetical protein